MPSLLRPRMNNAALAELSDLAGSPDATDRFFDVWDYFSSLRVGEADKPTLLGALTSSANLFASSPVFPTHDFMLRFTPHLQNWCALTYPMVGRFGLDDLQDLFQSLHQMHILPPRFFLDTSLDMIARYDGLGFVKRTHIIYNLACLGVTPPPALVRALPQTTKTLPERAFMYHYPLLLWSLACADTIAPAPYYRDIARFCVNRALATTEGEAANAGKAGMTFYACQWFDLPNPNEQPYQRNLTSSAYERDVGQMLQHLGFDLMHDHIRYLPELDKVADFALATPDGPVYLELDGPGHFVYNLGDGPLLRYDGSSRMISALLQKTRPETPFIRMPFTDMARLSHLPDDKLARTLKDIFATAVADTQSGRRNVQILSYDGEKPRLLALQP